MQPPWIYWKKVDITYHSLPDFSKGISNKKCKGGFCWASDEYKVIRNRGWSRWSQTPCLLLVLSRPYSEITGKSGFNTLLPVKAGNTRHFCRQLTKNQCERQPWSGFLEIRSHASNTVNSIRDRKGKLGKKGTEGAWKGTELRLGCGGGVQRHGRGSIYMAHNQQAAHQTSKDSRH